MSIVRILEQELERRAALPPAHPEAALHGLPDARQPHDRRTADQLIDLIVSDPTQTVLRDLPLQQLADLFHVVVARQQPIRDDEARRFASSLALVNLKARNIEEATVWASYLIADPDPFTAVDYIASGQRIRSRLGTGGGRKPAA